ncbi:MAG: YbaB/EbfC family nucleoid-associated protein [Acidobacteriota bacterium]|nr:YbaB/EbfC family nucleoid-associated protein [Acidobacteriota bacterium]
MNIQKLMKQAQQMQDKMQRELATLEVETSVGGGMLKLRMNGHKELLSVDIDPEVLDPEDPAMLQDLIVAAVNDASRKVDDAMREKVGGLGLQIPGLS